MELSTSKYEGEHDFGRYCGRGIMQMEDGKMYEGEFYNGRFHGHGTLHMALGKIEGQWEHGKHVDGTLTFSDGLEYAPTDWGYCTDGNRSYYWEKDEQDKDDLVPNERLGFCSGVRTPTMALVSAFRNHIAETDVEET